MDLDTLKTAWQQQQQLEAPPLSLLLDDVRQARWRLTVQDWAETISWVLMIALAAWISVTANRLWSGRHDRHDRQLRLDHRPAARDWSQETSDAKDASLQAFFRQELENVDWKIRQRRLLATWYTLPPAAGLALWFASLRPSALEWAGAGVVAVVAFLYSWWDGASAGYGSSSCRSGRNWTGTSGRSAATGARQCESSDRSPLVRWSIVAIPIPRSSYCSRTPSRRPPGGCSASSSPPSSE